MINMNRYECFWGDTQLRLTVTEFLLLECLASRPGHVKSRDQLMSSAYDDNIYVDDRTIDSHIKRLRKNLKVLIKSLNRLKHFTVLDIVTSLNNVKFYKNRIIRLKNYSD